MIPSRNPIVKPFGLNPFFPSTYTNKIFDTATDWAGGSFGIRRPTYGNTDEAYDDGLGTNPGTWSPRFWWYETDARGHGSLADAIWPDTNNADVLAVLAENQIFDVVNQKGRVYGRPASASLQALFPNDPNLGSVYPYVGGICTTRNSFLFKPPYVIHTRVKSADKAWSATGWTMTRPPGPNGNDDEPRFEEDWPEPIIAFNDEQSYCAIHWDEDAVAGGTYFKDETLSTVSAGVKLAQGFYDFYIWNDGTNIRYYFSNNATPFRTIAIPAAALAKNQWRYLVIEVDLGSTGHFSGDYGGTPNPTYSEIEFIRVYQPAGGSYIDRRTNPANLGRDIVVGKPSGGGLGGNYFWYDQVSTTSNGTKVWEVTPRIVPSAGATWHGREGYGNASANNGLVSGKVYRGKISFEYGTSGSGYFLVQTNAGSGIAQLSWTGSTVSLISGPITNISAISTSPFGWKEFTFDYTPGASGDSIVRVGPYSATSGQTILLYDVELRQYLP